MSTGFVDILKSLNHTYNNVISGLNSETTQDAIDELDEMDNHKRNKISGLENRINSWLDFNFITGELTLIANPNNGSIDYKVWSYGEPWTKTNESIILPTTDSEYIVYFDEFGEIQYYKPYVDTNFDNEIMENATVIARITINVSASEFITVLDLRFDVGMNPITRKSFIESNGTIWKSGLALKDFDIDQDGDLPEHAQFSIDDGEVSLADIFYKTSTRTQLLTHPAQIPVLYLDGHEWKLKAKDDFPVIYEGSVPSYLGTRIPYNHIDPATFYGSLVEVPNNDYVCVHYFASCGLYDGVVAMQGQYTYSNISKARSGALYEINRVLVNPIMRDYYTPLGSVIFNTENSDLNAVHGSIVSFNANEEYLDLRLSKTAFSSPSNAVISSFPQESFTIYDEREQHLMFNLDNTDPNIDTDVVWHVSPEDIDFRGVPQYKFITNASTALTISDPISLDVNGNAQLYTGSGGGGDSAEVIQFTTKTVVTSSIVYSHALTGVVAFTDGTPNTIFYVVVTQNPGGTYTLGSEVSITTDADVYAINSVKMDAGRVCFCWHSLDDSAEAQIVEVDELTQSLTLGTIEKYEGGGTLAFDVTFNSLSHLVFGIIHNDKVHTYWCPTDTGLTQRDKERKKTFAIPIGRLPIDMEVTHENDNIIIQYRTSIDELYWFESKWNPGVAPDGEYDDWSNEILVSTDAVKLGGLVSSNVDEIMGQYQKSNDTWQLAKADYVSGASITASIDYSSPLVAKLAKLLNTNSGIKYNFVLNATDLFEIWEDVPLNSQFEKILTTTNGVTTTVLTALEAVMFESQFGLSVLGDTAVNNLSYIIQSSDVTTENYIGNATATVNIGEPVEIVLCLPIICHPNANYSAGDILYFGPYKYQAISNRQLVIILEEIGVNP